MNIIGHQNILNYFNNSARNNTLAHAYLFSGPESVGKTTLAKWLIAKDAELDIKTETIPIDSHPDIFWIKRPEGKKKSPSSSSETCAAHSNKNRICSTSST